MPQNPHLVRKRTRDAGTAQQMADVHRRLKKTEGQATAIGDGATFTAPSITTASGKNGTVPTGAMIVMQGGGDQTFYPGEGAGIFCTDDAGAVALFIKPGIGLVLATGTSEVNYISWYTAGHLDGLISVEPESGGALMTLAAEGSGSMALAIGSYGSGTAAVAAYYNGMVKAVLSDAAGNGSFGGSLVVGGTLTIGNTVVGNDSLSMGAVTVNASGQLEVTSAGYTSSYYLYFNTASGSDITANYHTPSDEALKENVQALSAGDEISRLRPVTYVSKDTGKKHIGFVAQDIDSVIPDATHMFTMDRDGEQYMSYEMSAIVAHLVAEVQLLRKQLDEGGSSHE